MVFGWVEREGILVRVDRWGREWVAVGGFNHDQFIRR